MSETYTLRIIPEMSFICSGTIVGFTVAGRRRGMSRRDDPVIQIWRPQNISQLSRSTYYNTESKITTERSVCAENGFTVFSQESDNRNQVWKCNLCDANRVPVQAGDVLGLLLPPRTNTSFRLSVAGVSSKGPTNHVFEGQDLMSHTTVNLSNATSTNNQLPQIAIDVESGILISFICYTTAH
jgi:hypothetical protein